MVINIVHVTAVAGNIPSQMKKSSSIANVVAALFFTPPPNQLSYFCAGNGFDEPLSTAGSPQIYIYPVASI